MTVVTDTMYGKVVFRWVTLFWLVGLLKIFRVEIQLPGTGRGLTDGREI